MTPRTPNTSDAMSGHRRRWIRRAATVTTAVLVVGGMPLVAVALGGDADPAPVRSVLAPTAVPSSAASPAVTSDGPSGDRSDPMPTWSPTAAEPVFEPASPSVPVLEPAAELELIAAAAAAAADAAAAAAQEQALAEAVALLVDTYVWDEEGPNVVELQEMLGVVADGRYAHVTLDAHRARLEWLDLPTEGLPTAPVPSVPAGTSASAWQALRNCESGGNYSITNPSGTYRGAYQFDRSTWDSVAGRHAPHLVGVDPAAASPSDQDAMAHALYSERGASPWPSCGRHL